jgi:hypothetical protein
LITLFFVGTNALKNCTGVMPPSELCGRSSDVLGAPFAIDDLRFDDRVEDFSREHFIAVKPRWIEVEARR